MKWNLICLRNMLNAKSRGDLVSYFYWKDMLD